MLACKSIQTANDDGWQWLCRPVRVAKDLKRHGAQKAKAIVAQRQGQQDQNDAWMWFLPRKNCEHSSSIILIWILSKVMCSIYIFFGLDQTSNFSYPLEPLQTQKVAPILNAEHLTSCAIFHSPQDPFALTSEEKTRLLAPDAWRQRKLRDVDRWAPNRWNMMQYDAEFRGKLLRSVSCLSLEKF